jgi:hypothetical protein
MQLSVSLCLCVDFVVQTRKNTETQRHREKTFERRKALP